MVCPLKYHIIQRCMRGLAKCRRVALEFMPLHVQFGSFLSVRYIWDTHVEYTFTLTCLEHIHSVSHGVHSHLGILSIGRVYTQRYT